MTDHTEELKRIGSLMAQDLQEFVDEAVKDSGDPESLKGTQALIAEWEEVWKSAGGLSWQEQLTQQTGDDSDFCLGT